MIVFSGYGRNRNIMKQKLSKSKDKKSKVYSNDSREKVGSSCSVIAKNQKNAED